MKRFGITKRGEKVRGVTAGVDDAENLPLAPQAADELLVRGRPEPLDGGASQRAMEALWLVNDGSHAVQADGEVGAFLDRGLSGRAEDDGCPVVVDQLLESGQRGREQRDRQGLGLVEDDHALRQSVQLPASGGPAGKERLEELHVGRDDEPCVEVLRR